MSQKVIKNIGKLKQWTGEKFGSAKSTLQTEDFQRLEIETDRKRVAFEKVHASILLLQSQLLKVKVSPEDNKSKRGLHDVFGVCLNLYGNEFNEDSTLGIATINMGQAQSRLAVYQEEFADSVGMSYIEKLDEGMALYKDYQNLKKKLESRRLDLDAKLNKLQKSKKEKPELEQEMQAAKMKYEDTEYDLIQKMVALQDFEDEHCAALRHLLDLQCEYLSRSLETLNEVRENWTQPLVPRSQSNGGSLRRTSTMGSGLGLSRSISNTSATTAEELLQQRQQQASPRLSISRSSDTSNYGNNSPINSRRTFSTAGAAAGSLGASRKNSLYDRDESPMNNNGSQSPRIPPSLPRRQSSTSSIENTKNKRKAVYEFVGESADELSFHKGDIITVIEEVDEGWWLGEAGESNGMVRRGIFPVNYTEAISATSGGPPMPARPTIRARSSSNTTPPLPSSSLQQPTYIPEEEEEEEQAQETGGYEDEDESHTSSPFGDANRTTSTNNSNTRGFSYIRPNQDSEESTVTPPPKPTYKTNRAPPPPPASRGRSNSTARAPPPPMPSRSSNISLTSSSSTTTSRPVAASSSLNNNIDDSIPPNCSECGCDEYTANVFKKGHCNNCFHKH